jgi:L-asparaginase II
MSAQTCEDARTSDEHIRAAITHLRAAKIARDMGALNCGAAIMLNTVEAAYQLLLTLSPLRHASFVDSSFVAHCDLFP